MNQFLHRFHATVGILWIRTHENIDIFSLKFVQVAFQTGLMHTGWVLTGQLLLERSGLGLLWMFSSVFEDLGSLRLASVDSDCRFILVFFEVFFKVFCVYAVLCCSWTYTSVRSPGP